MAFKGVVAASLGGAVLLLAGCASYGPMPEGTESSGYRDKRIGDNKYWVFYRGDVYDTSSSVLALWEKRANDLCGGRGYSGTPVEGAKHYTYQSYAPGSYGTFSGKLVQFEGEITCNN